MTRNRFFLLVLTFLLFSFNQKDNDQLVDKGKWVTIFNGKNLDGWSLKISG
jgi:hypothetical protein